jgi:hypothetical protein
MYTIIAPVPQKVAAVITPLRQEYDPAVKIIPPHISVIKPFHYARPLSELHDHLEEIGTTHAPIKVSLVGWDVCEQTHQFQLPLIAGRSEFITLQNNLLTGPLSPIARPAEAYRPHITFGQFSNRTELEAAKEILKKFEPQFIFRVTHLELLQRDKLAQPWQLQERFGLEATLASHPRKKKQWNLPKKNSTS